MDIVKGLLWGLLLCGMLSALAGCGASKTVMAPEYHTRDSVRTQTQRDSVYVSDSVYVYVHGRGDTVFVEKTKIRNVYRGTQRTDTVKIARTDSVRVPYPVIREKEVNRLYWWQETLMWAGAASVILAGVLAYGNIRGRI